MAENATPVYIYIYILRASVCLSDYLFISSTQFFVRKLLEKVVAAVASLIYGILSVHPSTNYGMVALFKIISPTH